MSQNVVIIQPSIPRYRIDFFDRLSAALGERLSVYGSTGDLGALTAPRELHTWERQLGPIVRILPGVEWQRGVKAVPIRSGDVVVVSGGPRCLSNLALLLRARLRGATTVWWGHYWSATSRSWRFGLRLLLMRLSDVVLFYTDEEAGEYLARARFRPQPAFALNNGIALDDVHLRRVEYRAEERGRTLLFIGRLTEKSKLPLLLRSLADRIVDDVCLEVVGSGKGEESLRNYAECLGLASRVVWHGAITEESRIAEVANRCALFVYPGAVGLSLIHTMAYGLPAILHDDRRRHMPEIVAFENEVTGLCFRVNDGHDLAKQINRALENPARLNVWSKTGRERVDCLYNTAAMARRFLAMLEAVREKGGSHDNRRR